MATNKKFISSDFYKKNKEEIDRNVTKTFDDALENLQKLGFNETSPGDISQDFIKNRKEIPLCRGYPTAMTGMADGN